VWCGPTSSSDGFSRDAGLAGPGSAGGDRGEASTGGALGPTTAGSTGQPAGGLSGESETTGAVTGTGGSPIGTTGGTTAGTTGATGIGGVTTGGMAPDPMDPGITGGTDSEETPVDCLNCVDDDPDAGTENGSSCEEADECSEEVGLSGEEKSLDAGSMQLLSASVQWSPASADELTVFVRGRDALTLPMLMVVGMRTPDGSPFAPGRYGPVSALVSHCVGDAAREQGIEAKMHIRSLGGGFEGTLELRGADWTVAFDVEQPAVCEPPG